MKKPLLLLLGLVASMSSCDLITSLPSGTYMQNQALVAKPFYKGQDTSMVRISAGYSMLDIAFSEGTWTENGDTLWSSDDAGRGSWIQQGFIDVSYGKSTEHFSYGIGLIGTYGEFNEVFSTFSRSVQRYTTAGLGVRGNVSLDVNRPHVSMRALQLQFGLSRDFGDYAENRQAIADSYPDFASVPHLAPANALLGDISITNLSTFHLDAFRFGIGGGFNFNTAISEGLNPELSSVNGMLVFEAGVSNFDLYINYSAAMLPRNVGTNFRAGLAYRINF